MTKPSKNWHDSCEVFHHYSLHFMLIKNILKLKVEQILNLMLQASTIKISSLKYA